MRITLQDYSIAQLTKKCQEKAGKKAGNIKPSLSLPHSLFMKYIRAKTHLMGKCEKKSTKREKKPFFSWYFPKNRPNLPTVFKKKTVENLAIHTFPCYNK